MAELLNEFSWSVSRADTFNYCQRKYFFSYYEAWDGWNRFAAERKKKAYFLKKRATVDTWVGDVVHRAIRYTIENITTATPEFILNSISRRLSADFQKSLSREFLKRPKEFGLFEHYKGSDVLLPQVTEKARTLLEKFFESEVYHELRKLPKENIIYLDSPDMEQMKFTFDGLPVFAIPDLCYKRSDGSYCLVDWKTGAEREEELSAQVKMYALRLLIVDGIDAANEVVCGYNYYLSQGTLKGRQVTAEDLQQIRREIHNSKEQMHGVLLNAEVNLPQPEQYFPRTSSVSKCSYCTFREICQS